MKRSPLLFSILAAIIGFQTARAQSALSDHPIIPTEYRFIADTLQLDEHQRTTLATLYEGSQVAFRAEAAKLNELRQKYRQAQQDKTPDEELLREQFFQALVDFISYKRKFDHSFMDDVQSLLSPDQMQQNWPVVERAHRRNLLRSIYPDSATVWNHADLIRCVKDVKLAPEAEQLIAPQLLEYETRLDEILIRRERHFWSETGLYLNPSDADAERNATEIAKAGADCNKKYAKILLAILPEEEAQKLEHCIYSAAYMHLYGLTCEEANAMPKALQLENLREDQREALQTLYKKWQTDLADFHRKERIAYDQADATLQTMPTTEREAIRGNQEKDPMFTVWIDSSVRHAELAKNFAANMRKILTPAQQGKLWPPPTPQPVIDPKTVERGGR